MTRAARTAATRATKDDNSNTASLALSIEKTFRISAATSIEVLAFSHSFTYPFVDTLSQASKAPAGHSNGEQLSPEGLESELYELKRDNIVEFGIDIVGEDNKTIIYHKVAAHVKIHTLEGVIAEHDAIQREVGLLMWLVEICIAMMDGEREEGFSGGAGEICAIILHELEIVEEEDSEQMARQEQHAHEHLPQQELEGKEELERLKQRRTHSTQNP
ncbi:hypothetical protein PILCRDRAFT_17055 [Piloderma croceum F 1598]|uniref:Uncharacterized protein n=1 Tax=Piloderma croceum (strain F 1598) TaxID=765440 RepID=A0A0C3EUD8_PILCF|nr:hypothetical protein PILCRDRAFT_17055 [Piloderma croceum F 1598]